MFPHDKYIGLAFTSELMKSRYLFIFPFRLTVKLSLYYSIFNNVFPPIREARGTRTSCRFFQTYLQSFVNVGNPSSLLFPSEARLILSKKHPQNRVSQRDVVSLAEGGHCNHNSTGATTKFSPLFASFLDFDEWRHISRGRSFVVDAHHECHFHFIVLPIACRITERNLSASFIMSQKEYTSMFLNLISFSV